MIKLRILTQGMGIEFGLLFRFDFMKKVVLLGTTFFGFEIGCAACPAFPPYLFAGELPADGEGPVGGELDAVEILVDWGTEF